MNGGFSRPAYDENGLQTLTEGSGEFADALMHTAVQKMEKGAEYQYCFPKEEAVFLLIEGKVSFRWPEGSADAMRNSCFDGGAQSFSLHVCRNTLVTIYAMEDSEVFIAHTFNNSYFTAMLYTPQDIQKSISCADICDGCCERIVTTVFDDVSKPYSNFVLGEIYPKSGRWCGYPPHSHPQPEVYYYRIDRPEGFGFCCIGENAYKIRDRSFTLQAHGAMHPQVVAPGYNMFIIWIIRHLPDNPWHRGENLPEYQWLEKLKY